MSTYTWPVIKAKLREAVLALPNFFRNPIQGMRQLPSWDWPELIILQCVFAVACATLKNIVDRDMIGFFVDFVLSPIAAVSVTCALTAIFYYGFKFMHNRKVGFLPLYTNIVFAAIPFHITNIISKYVPPIHLVGLAAALILFHVGLVHNFQVERARLKKWLIGLYALFILSWAVQLMNSTYKREGMKTKFSPEDIKLLEQEMSPAQAE